MTHYIKYFFEMGKWALFSCTVRGCVEFEFNELLHTKNNSKRRRSVSLYYHKYNLL